MKCHNCHTKNNIYAKYCNECGQSLITDSYKIQTEPESIKINVGSFGRSVNALYDQQKLFLSNLSDIAWIKDIHGIYIYANEAYAKAVGIEQSKMIGKTDYDFWSVEFAEKYQLDDNMVIQSKQLMIIEEPFQVNNTVIETIKTPFLNENGDVIATIGIARDITSRVRLNQQLSEKNKQLQNYIDKFHETDSKLQLTQKSVEMSMIPTFWLNSKAEVLATNQIACDVLGYSKDEFLTMKVHDFDPWYKEKDWQKNWEKFKEQKHITFESLHKKKDGSTFFVEITSNYFVFEGMEYIFSYARDISERKQFENELIVRNKELEETFEKLKKAQTELRLTQKAVDLSLVGAFWVDKNANIIRVNKAACDLIGYTEKELTSMKVFDFDPNYPKENWKENWEIWKKEKTAVFESSQKNKDGSIHPTEIYLNFFEFEGEEYIFTNVKDITERKQHEKEILDRNVKLQEAFDKIKQTESKLLLTQIAVDITSVSVFWVEEDAKIVRVNQATANSLGYTQEELCQMFIYDIDPLHSKDVWIDKWNNFKQNKTMTFESVQIRKDGVTFPVEITANFFVFEGKEYVFANGKDITYRKQYEKEILDRNKILLAKEEELCSQNEELQSKEEELISQNEELQDLYDKLQLKERELANEKAFLLAALSQSSTGIVIAEAPNGLIKFANSAALSIIGDTGYQLTNIPMENYQHNWQVLRPDRTIFESEKMPLSLALLNGTVSHNVEAILFNEKVGDKEIAINAAPIYDIDGNIIAAMAVFQDITDKKRYERQLKEEHKQLEIIVDNRTEELKKSLSQLKDSNLHLEQAHQHKNRFISSMSHELRTPLNAIIGFTQTLEKKYFGDLNEKQMEYIALVMSSGQHLLSLINDILDIAKIDSGSMQLSAEYINIDKCINDIVSIMSTQFNDKKIILEHFIEENIDTVYSDERKFKQILFNLLSNALKFTKENGKVTIKVVKEDDYINVSVTDNGIGIKEQDLDKVFNEFYQSDDVRDQALGGAGIGLTLTRRLVEIHGGAIGVESKLDQGSKFWFTMPIKDYN